MIVYRICNTIYNEDLTGTGSKLFGGRWNSKGIPMLYVSQNISLAVLEMLVNNQFKDFATSLSLLKISIPDNCEIPEIKLAKLKLLWNEDFSYTKFMGNEFIKSMGNIAIKVPSTVIPEEHNYLLNPLHKDYKKIKIIETILFKTDKRLFTL